MLKCMSAPCCSRRSQILLTTRVLDVTEQELACLSLPGHLHASGSNLMCSIRAHHLIQQQNHESCTISPEPLTYLRCRYLWNHEKPLFSQTLLSQSTLKTSTNRFFLLPIYTVSQSIPPFFFFWETNNHIPRSKLIHICVSVVWCWAWSAFLLLFLFFSFSFFWAPLRITALKRPGVPPQGSSLARPCCVAVAGPEDAVRGRRLSGGCSKWESMSHLLVYGTYSTEYIPQREGWLRLSDQKLWEIEGWVDFEVGLSISYIRYSTVCTVSTLVYCNEKYISLIIHSSCD